MPINIITGPVQSGKTTWLMNWANGRTDISGFLCPDIDGIRHYFQLDTKKMIPFEVDESCLDEVIPIGRFRFLKNTFDKAKSWLDSTVINSNIWFVIDEIGKLEMNGKGFEPELSRFIERIKSTEDRVALILVVRDSLLEQVCHKYHLEDANIINIEQLLDGKITFFDYN